MCSPVKAGAHDFTAPTSAFDALDPGFRRGTQSGSPQRPLSTPLPPFAQSLAIGARSRYNRMRPEGRAIAAAQAGEESPGSTETTVPDNVRRLPRGSQGKCHREQNAKGFGPAKGERVR